MVRVIPCEGYVLKQSGDIMSFHIIFWFTGRDVCTDIPYYSDKNGVTCKKAVESGKCSNARPVGDTEDERKKIEEELDGNKNSDGVSLMDACCECGGGQG